VSNIRSVLGSNIRRIRLAHHWTRVALAEKADISPTFLLHIENGTRGVSLETVECLAKSLEVSVSQLFDHCTVQDGDAPPDEPSPEMRLEEEIKRQVSFAIHRYLEEISAAKK